MLSAITTVHGPLPLSPSISCATENRDISVVFLTFLGSKEVVVLSGVLDLVFNLLLLSALTVKPYLFCWQAAGLLCKRLMKFKKKVLFSINGLF